MDKRPADASAQQGQRAHKIRTRISSACTRCQKRKIRCDALSPACSACQKAGVPCVGGGLSREFSRSYVIELESRVKWLESVIQEHIPGFDLSAGPGRSPSTDDGIPVGDSNPSQPIQSTHESRDVGSLSKITDQIGLISITTGTDLRFLGPSSGLFFTKFVLAGLGKRLHTDKTVAPEAMTEGVPVPIDLLVPQPKELPSEQKQARWLSQAYFNTVHLQFPFLHEPSHWETVEKIYSNGEVGVVGEFQVLIVLAIGASILSRRTRIALSAEGYFASAMKLASDVLKISSFTGAQCNLLLQMYALNNSTSGLSLWTLHHYGLALVIELGMHRNMPASRFTPFDREIRRRIFWCTYTIDRLLSTLMGRPMGVVDEQCELNYPSDVDDRDLKMDQLNSRQTDEPITNMTFAIHLFKLARFNSEIKCFLYCVDREHPPYTQPMIVDADSWRVDILERLRQWRADIPKHTETNIRHHMDILSEIKYHEMVMLILRPNPRFQYPDKASLRECFSSAMACCELYHQLYVNNSLHYGWISVHSLFLCVMVMFYCVWVPHKIVNETDFDSLMRALKVSSDVLSAMGEYWPEAKTSRDMLDRVSMATIRRFTRQRNVESTNATSSDSLPSATVPSLLGPSHAPDWGEAGLASEGLTSLQFGETSAMDDPFGLGYGVLEHSFTSAETFSQFLGSGIDMAITGAYDLDSNGDRDMEGFLEGGLGDINYSQ